MDEPPRTDRLSPPTEWCDWWPGGLTQVADEIYYGWPEGEDHPWFWHWCPKRGRWRGAGTGQHTVISREPLHLEPSLVWPCCGLHGWVWQGIWSPA